jgi:hypothetical protein
MSRYIITITPDGGGAAAHTTVRVDTSSGQTRVTELTVEAGSGAGLAPADLPPIDLDLLVRALTAPARVPAVTAAAAPVVSTSEPAAVEPATAVRQRRRASAAPAKSAKASNAKKTTRAGAGRNAAANAKKTAAAGKATAGGGRAYRRMPEPDLVMDAYRQTGSITALAEHFGVPRHTVTGWARRLRTQGHAIGRQ